MEDNKERDEALEKTRAVMLEVNKEFFDAIVNEELKAFAIELMNQTYTMGFATGWEMAMSQAEAEEEDDNVHFIVSNHSRLQS